MKMFKTCIEKELERTSQYSETVIRESLEYCDTFTNMITKKNMEQEHFSTEKIADYLNDLNDVEEKLLDVNDFKYKEKVFTSALLNYILDKKEMKNKFTFSFLNNVFLQQEFKIVLTVFSFILFVTMPLYFSFKYNAVVSASLFVVGCLLGVSILIFGSIVILQQLTIDKLSYKDIVKLSRDTSLLESLTEEFEKHYQEYFEENFNLLKAQKHISHVKNTLTSYLKSA